MLRRQVYRVAPMRALRILAAIMLVSSLAWAPHPSLARSSIGRPTISRATTPNVVLILTDDQRWDTLWAMPNLQSELVRRGVTFSNAFVVNSLCCPTRTSILTGQYSHSTLVYDNAGPYGGFPAFHQDDNTVATWLHDAGYYTGLYGKYLNLYQSLYIPPGWDRWGAFYGGKGEEGAYYYNYTLNQDGALTTYGSSEADYSTDVLAGFADSFIRTAPVAQPLFLYLAPFGPHLPATPAPRDAHEFGDLQPWRPPNYNEADVSDKPAWVQALPSLATQQQKQIDRQRRNEYRSLLSVDDAIDTVVRALTDTGRLSNTLIVFTSDNGLAWGEHRWTGKKVSWEESIRVPMVVRDDAAIGSARTDSHLVADIDIGPTFAAAAGVASPDAEGLSFLPLLSNPGAKFRHDVLIEHLQNDTGRDQTPTFCAVRDDALQREGFAYTLYVTGEEELYDLKLDPYELANVAGDPGYASQLASLQGQEARLCVPPPPGWP
jgi:N-acetylglucosamine-6-sulfatase